MRDTEDADRAGRYDYISRVATLELLGPVPFMRFLCQCAGVYDIMTVILCLMMKKEKLVLNRCMCRTTTLPNAAGIVMYASLQGNGLSAELTYPELHPIGAFCGKEGYRYGKR